MSYRTILSLLSLLVQVVTEYLSNNVYNIQETSASRNCCPNRAPELMQHSRMSRSHELPDQPDMFSVFILRSPEADLTLVTQRGQKTQKAPLQRKPKTDSEVRKPPDSLVMSDY